MKICVQCRYFYHGHKGKISLCTNRHSNKFPDKVSHNGHTHVCRFFRPPKHSHSDSILEVYKDKLNFIENLRGTYSGREIWIFATGPSLDGIPGDFLRMDETREPDENGNQPPRISIAVKEAAILFPDCTYNIWPFRDYPLRHTYLPHQQISSDFGKFIFTIRQKDRINYYGQEILKPIYMRYAPGGTMEKMKLMCENIIAGNSTIYCGVGTITHLAIIVAVIMGAKKISLVGCDHGAVDGKLHFQKIDNFHPYGWKNSVADSYEDMKVGTNFLANFFRPHGVEIVRYYHELGYKKIGAVIEDKEAIKKAEDGWKDILKKSYWGKSTNE